MSNPSEWLNMYPHNFSNQSPLLSDDDINSPSAYADALLSDATLVTTTLSSSATAPTSAASLSPDGRVAKPVRRRSRASRRTPTTLLNTDAANFRAMVQQFTGGPSNAAAVQNFTFGFGGSRPAVDPTAIFVPPGYHLPQQQQPPPQLLQQYDQQAPFMFSLNNSHANTPGEAFLQTHGGSRPVTYSYMGPSDRAPGGPPPPS